MIASVIEAGELTCEPNDLVISYQMNGRGKIHLIFIKNDRHVSLYMLDIGIDGSRPTLRIHVNVRPPIEPTNSFDDDNNSIGNERLGDHSKESLVDHSNESLGDHSMNIHDDPTNVENQSIDAEDPEHECYEKIQGEQELRSQSNHSFSDETNLYINQTFNNKNESQLLLADAVTKMSFDFATLRKQMSAVAIVLEYDIGFEKWSRAYFTGNRYDVMTTNITESLNAMLIDERKYPVALIFNSFAKRFEEIFRKRHAYILKSMGNQMSEWCVPEELLNVKILPPFVDIKLGRKRDKGVGENFKSKRRNKCSIYKRTGLKRTTCVNNNKS
ncbi:hypothetical protein H5410_045456 [Solanum commersonii]|uniref:Uncharacterized protein n=1 Tax=Solanum commersonii TaxID=4109 RepID=A0A9J5XCR4_SOLCO|nr:hypothetical protein H5410_045456 [Solanum commersonii]